MRIPSLRRGVMALAGIASGFGCAAAFTLQSKVHAEPVLHPRSHTGPFDSLDRDSIRRGYQVYKQACSACHSMRHVHDHDLMDIGYTEDEAIAEAEEIQVEDNETGYFPGPVGHGGLPIDLAYLSYYGLALERQGYQDLDVVLQDYIFHHLTGHCSPPAGVMLDDEAGTLAKDVCTFLMWASPEATQSRLDMEMHVLRNKKHDLERKKKNLRICMLVLLLLYAL